MARPQMAWWQQASNLVKHPRSQKPHQSRIEEILPIFSNEGQRSISRTRMRSGLRGLIAVAFGVLGRLRGGV